MLYSILYNMISIDFCFYFRRFFTFSSITELMSDSAVHDVISNIYEKWQKSQEFDNVSYKSRTVHGCLCLSNRRSKSK